MTRKHSMAGSVEKLSNCDRMNRKAKKNMQEEKQGIVCQDEQDSKE